MSTLFGNSLANSEEINTAAFVADDNRIVLRTNGVDRISIDQFGNMFLGGEIFSNPNEKIVILDETPAIRFSNGTSSLDTQIGMDSSQNFSINSLGDTELKFLTNNTNRLIITNEGNVNIGTTTSEISKLFVDGDVSIGITTGSSQLNVGGNVLIESAAPQIVVSNTTESSSILKFQDTQASSSQFFNLEHSADSNYFRINSQEVSVPYEYLYMKGGNVGIGTTTMASRVQVNGDVQIREDTSGGKLIFNTTGTNRMLIGAYSSVNNIDSGARVLKLFNNSAANALCIGTSGNIGLGTDTPTHALHSVSDDCFKPTTPTWSYTSDPAHKENIETANLDTCYLDIKNLDLKYFKWKDEFISKYNVQDKHQLGFLSTDLQYIKPKSVNQLSDGTNVVDPSQLIMTLLGAVKRIQIKINSLVDSLNASQNFTQLQSLLPNEFFYELND